MKKEYLLNSCLQKLYYRHLIRIEKKSKTFSISVAISAISKLLKVSQS